MNPDKPDTCYFVCCLLGRREPEPLYAPEVWRRAVPPIDRLVGLSTVKKPMMRTYQSATYPKAYGACRGDERQAYSARRKLHDSTGWLKFGASKWAGDDRLQVFERYSGLSNWKLSDTLIFCGERARYLAEGQLPDVVLAYCNYWRSPNTFPPPSHATPLAFDQSFTLVLRADLLEANADTVRGSLREVAGLLNTVDGVEFSRAWRVAHFPHPLMRALGGVSNCDVLGGSIVFDLWRQPIELHPAFAALPHIRLSQRDDGKVEPLHGR